MVRYHRPQQTFTIASADSNEARSEAGMEMNESDIARRSFETMWANDAASQGLGMKLEMTGPGCAQARFEVRGDMLNGHDVCHGGFLFALADSACAFACNSYNIVTVSSSASIEFVRPARLGDKLLAVATERHRGGRTGIYDVTIRNQDQEVVALFLGRSYATCESIY